MSACSHAVFAGGPLSRRQRAALAVCAALLLGVILFVCLYGYERAEQLYVGQLQDTLRLQENAVQGMLDDASALLMETCDNYRLIDVGRSAEQDPWQVTEMACSELGRLVSMHRDISSAYLVCNLPRFVCTSHSLQPYEMDAFFDVSWLNQYFASQQGIQLLDTPRPVTTPARNQDTYISLVSRVSYLSTLKNKWLIFNISTRDLSRQLYSPSSPRSGVTALYNRKGELIYAQDGFQAPPALSTVIQAVESGVCRLSLGSIPYLVAADASIPCGWTAVSFVPIVMVRRAAWGMLMPMLAVIVLLIVLMAFSLRLIIRFTRKHVESVCLETAAALGTTPGTPSVRWIQDTAIAIHAESRRKDTVLDAFFPIIRDKVVLETLRGALSNHPAQPVYEDILSQIGFMKGDGFRYAALVIYTDAISDIKANLSRGIYNQFLYTMQCECNEQLPPGMRAFYVRVKSSYLAAIVCIPPGHEQEELLELWESVGDSIQQHLTLLSKQPVYVAFGDTRSDYHAVSESFEHAMLLIASKLHTHQSAPCTYSRLLDSEIQLSYDHIKQLTDLLRLGKVEKASELLARYFTTLSANPQVSIEKARQIGASLANTIFGAVSEYAREEDQLRPGAAPQLRELDTCLSIHEVAEILLHYLKVCGELAAARIVDRKEDRMQDILVWIRENYCRDIALDDIAERMGLSATYASKQFKAYTGISFVNYINELRIQRAKELLSTTEMTTNEISAYVGYHSPQSFNRCFGRLCGMTPGHYRQLNSPKMSAESGAPA